MQNTRKIFAALLITSGLLSCNSNSPSVTNNSSSQPPKRAATNPGPSSPNPNPTPSSHAVINPLTWVLKLQSKCQNNVTNNQCVAAFGFTLMSDGHYQIGPGPQGETRTGTLIPEDINSLHTALESTLSASGLTAESHDTLSDPISNDILTIAVGRNPSEPLLKTEGTDFYFTISSAADAKTLYKSIRTLATKYYSLPFPDSCLDGVSSLETLYTSLQTCTSDSDCSYFDLAFSPIESASTEYLTTDDCTLIRPLVVGNTSAIRTSQAKLKETLDKLKTACGDRLVKSDCTGVTGFQLTGSSGPVCQEGTCKVNPSLQPSSPH